MSYLGAWSIKGVDETAKVLAKRAAAEANVTMGVWLEAAIAKIARHQGIGADVKTDTIDSMHSAAPAPALSLPAPTVSGKTGQKIFGATIHLGNLPALPADIGQLPQQIAQIEKQLAEDFSALTDRVEHIEEILTARLPAQPPVPEENYTIATTGAVYDLSAINIMMSAPPQPQASPAAPAPALPSWRGYADMSLRLAIWLTLLAIAFLLGQRLAVGLLV